MKEVSRILLTLFLSFIALNELHAQAFQEGNKNVDVGIAFGAYGTKLKVSNTVSTASGSSSSDSTYTDTDGAASTIIPISFEYGLTDKIGLGADLTISNYFIDEEDEDEIARVNAFDFGIRSNYHLLNADKNDLMIGAGIGFSSINWEAESNPNQFIDSYSGSGIYWTVALTDRIFFSEHVGILFNLSYRGYFYSALEVELSPEGEEFFSSRGAKFEQELDWTFNGFTIGTGLAVKF